MNDHNIKINNTQETNKSNKSNETNKSKIKMEDFMNVLQYSSYFSSLFR